MLFRAGILNYPGYIGAINDKLRNYASGEGKDVSLQEFVRRKSVNESNLNELDYRRGAVIALWLDATIRDESNRRSLLRNVMLDLDAQNTAYQRRHRRASMELTNERIFLTAAKYLAPTSLKAFQQYLEVGGEIPVPQDALGPCVQAKVETVTSFDLGFDRQSIEDSSNVVRGVEPASEAYKAGVRDGQKLTGTSIYFGDTTKPVRLWVATPSGQQVITYYPRGASIPVEQFMMRQGSFDSRLCSPAVM